ncbi:hypothetical protein BASA61_006362 [Batrachochytrium salamandrivorans]|nr:hypothetical protein BASA62_010199 [Batrachochytrium salamandrivorans]KAH6587174.1 hypothetical protein BASA61_006362 [Batrachochytrium salamandrivorans]KAH9249781.1 6-phosphogluconolactonase [Batrachochytrium salamandrivorans]KAH9264982.1 6-phosphogluconolactonase [Batrachochytrium salamandrivorans]
MLQESIYAFPSSTALSEALDTLIERLSAQAISQRGAFTIALSGGSLPKILAAKLRDNKTIDFTKWHVLYADERCVPLADPESNYGASKTTLLDAIPVPAAQVMTLSEALAHTPEAAAADYQTKLMDAVKDKTSAGVPRIDAVLLGMGPDGHTCSLFPGHALLDVTDHYVAAIHDSPKPPLTRITLTYPVVNASHNVIFVATGESKANVLHRMVDLNEDFPSARVNPTSGNLYWFLDTAAASQLSVPAKLFKL